MHPLRFMVLACLAAACHSVPGADGDAGVSTTAAPAPDTAAPATATPSFSPPVGPGPAGSPEQAPTLTGSTIKLKLQSGAELTLPAIAAEKNAPARERLPETVVATHLYHLGSNKRLLLVNEFALGDKDCTKVIDEELSRLNDAKADTDPTRTKFRQLGKVETLTIAGDRALYADSMNRGSAGIDAGRPAVAMATMITCRGKDHVVLMYTLDQPDLPTGTKQMLSDIVASYSASR